MASPLSRLAGGRKVKNVPGPLSHIIRRSLKQPQEMFVFLILFWDIRKFGDAGEESNSEEATGSS